MGEQKKEFRSIKDLSVIEIELSDYLVETDCLQQDEKKEQEKEETAEK